MSLDPVARDALEQRCAAGAKRRGLLTWSREELATRARTGARTRIEDYKAAPGSSAADTIISVLAATGFQSILENSSRYSVRSPPR